MTKPTIFTRKPQLPRGTVVHDTMKSALGELYFEEHPTIPKGRHDPKALSAFIAKHDNACVWAYYSWRNTVVRLPREATYHRLRTARNRNLITDKEQQQYRAARVGIAGLSVGSSVLSALVATGGPKRLKIADPDELEITNLNRIRATLLDVGANKAQIAARAAWEVDPFLQIEAWEQGIARDSLKRFVRGLTVFVDEMDAIELKFLARLACREAGIPVVMATDNGDSIILDVERFDLEPRRPIFHGRVSMTPEEMRTLGREAFVKLSSAIIDPTLLTQRQQASIMEVGRTLASIPRIGTAAALSGAAVAFAVRAIATKAPLPSGRYTMGCEPSFIQGYDSARARARRGAHTKKFLAALSKRAR